VLVGAFGR